LKNKYIEKNKKNFYTYLLLNIPVLSIFFLGLMNFYPQTFLQALLIGIPIVILQYPLLLLKKNWFYKTFIYFLSMLVFLFTLGVSFYLKDTVVHTQSFSITEMIKSGIITLILGQFFGGFFAFLIIVYINWALKDILFDTTG